MQHLAALIVLAPVLALASPLPAWAGAFEGVVHMKDVNAGARGEQAVEFDYFIKGDKVRVEMPGREGPHSAIVMDAGAQKGIILMPKQHMYMELPMGEAAQNQQDLASVAKSAVIVKTGKTDTILGYTCDIVLVKSEYGDSEVCTSKELGQFVSQRMAQPRMGRQGGTGHGERDYAWAKELGKGFFPLRAVTRDEAGKELNRLEATKIDKKPLDSSLFAVPDGYTKFDMAGVMRGLEGMLGGKGLPPGMKFPMPPGAEMGN
jgi:hypothetical protein